MVGIFPSPLPRSLGGDRGSYTHIMLGGATRAESQNYGKGAKKAMGVEKHKNRQYTTHAIAGFTNRYNWRAHADW